MNRSNRKHNPKAFLQSSFRIVLITSMFTTMVSACTSLSRPEETTDLNTLSEYADDLFIRQNQASSTLMVLPEDEIDEDEYAELLEAEQEMLRACQPFNQYATMITEGLKPGLLLRNRIYRSLDECDEATTELESLLDPLD